MEKYNITGMSCAACSARVEKAVRNINGVKNCTVNLLTNSMTVEGNAKSPDIISAVENAGYGASLQNEKSDNNKKENSFEKDEKNLFHRLVFSLVFLIFLMYFSMGHTMLGLPLPEFFHNNFAAMGLAQMLLTIAIMVINQKFFISGTKAVLHRSSNMDTLVSLGSAAAFIYSTAVLFKITSVQNFGQAEITANLYHNLYFESAGMILTLITVGKMLEAHSKGKTTNALKGLMELSPETATVIRDEKEIEISAKDVIIGDILAVKPGEKIPVDARVIEGNSAVDQSALTGESIPADKKIGDKVFSGTINKSGFLKCKALKVGEDTTLSQVIKMVSDASATKAPISRIADKVSGIFVPTVIAISVITFAVWLLLGKEFSYALARAISVLVISCPCALGLATPVAIMVGSGVGAKNGILFKTASALESAGKIDTVIFDKTGTITKGRPQVTDIICSEKISEKELLECAFSVEKLSEHPLAKAVVNYCEVQKITLKECEDFRTFSGNGVSGKVNSSVIYGGNISFLKDKTEIPNEYILKAQNLSKSGKTPLFFAKDQQFLGIISVADVIKEESPDAVLQLKNIGIKVVMLTGDNKITAEEIGRQVGADEIISEVLPADKEKYVRKFGQQGKVAMVGDGINDAPALTSADLGIAIGDGTDIAIDSADAVLINSKLTDVPAALRLGRKVMKNIKENLFWAFVYNTLGIPLAAGVFGLQLNPMFAAAAMSLSSFCVVTNALRLNFTDIHKQSKHKKTYKNKSGKEVISMTKTMKIEGMMCTHCENRVKKVLESLPQIDSADVSFEKGTAIITLKEDISDDTLKNTIEEQDYKVISIE